MNTDLVSLLTPVLVPLIIAAWKKWGSDLPGWLIPPLAALLGALGTLIDHYATGASANPTAGILLGLAGVGVRELKDQIVPAAKP